MNKLNRMRLLCIVLFIIVVVLFFTGKGIKPSQYKDKDSSSTITDPNTILLDNGRVKVSFSDVILSKPEETRKIVVFEVDGTITEKLEDNWAQKFGVDADIFKKIQNVSYTCKGSFVVDLDNMTSEDIIDDEENKQLIIRIEHPHLDTLEIDPYKIKVGEQKKGLLTIGDLKLTVANYVSLQKIIKDKYKDKFDSVANGQKADDIAIKKVCEIYEPVVKAVASDYSVKIEFKEK